MTDEEKKAIEFVKSELQDEKIARNDYQSLTGLYGNLEIETVLNIIKKLSKQIEKLYKSLEDDIGNIVNLGILVDENAREKRDVSKYIDEVQIFLNTLNYNYVSKDKIKAKIEEVKDGTFDAKIVLQSLLEKEY